jgi:hypothetical protein
MRHSLVLLLVLGCAEHGHTPNPDGPGDPAVCKASREAAIDRSCTTPSDCVLVTSSDCCGPIDIAVKRGTEGAYPPVEAAYVSCLACPPLGCAHQVEAENGSPAGSGTIVATCVMSRCQSIVQ